MKQGRKLTRLEKSCLVAQGHNPAEYMFLQDINDSYFKIIHKKKKKIVIVDKYHKAKSKFDYGG